MARTWLSVTVELLGGRGEQLWPYPGRDFAVGPSHTFLDLADSINAAFARWDLAHLSVFTLTDGRVITDEESGAEFVADGYGDLFRPIDIAKAKISGTLKLGDEFKFTFDLGDNWTHRCVIGPTKIDPWEVLGVQPDRPLPYWGWGSMPDQYGRRWGDDVGEGPVPPAPVGRHPMDEYDWPPRETPPAIDEHEVRQAIAAADANRFIAAIEGRDVDKALQLIAEGIPITLSPRRKWSQPIALSIINRLIVRDEPGDQALAEDLLAVLRGE